MKDFKKQGHFGDKRGGGFGGGNRGGDRGGDRGFRDGGRAEMFEAVCSDCGKNCEVPFRPNGQKPVYCKECFGRNSDRTPSSDNYERKSFAPKFAPASAPAFAPRASGENSQRIDDIFKRLNELNTKLDQVLARSQSVQKSAPVTVATPAKVEKVEAPKVEKKAVAVKKVAVATKKAVVAKKAAAPKASKKKTASKK